MDEPIIQDDIIEAKVSKEIIDNLSTDIASKYDEKLSEIEDRESSKYVWLSFVVILFSLVATYSVVGNYIKERFVSYLEFNTRSKLGQDVKIAKNLKILVKDDNLIAHMGKPNLSMDEWVEILQSVAAHKPKAIYIDKIFSITGFKESDTSKKEKFNEAIEKIMDIDVPIFIGASIHPTKIPLREPLQFEDFIHKKNIYVGNNPDKNSFSKAFRYTAKKNIYSRHNAYKSAFQSASIDYIGQRYINPLLRVDDEHVLPHLGIIPAQKYLFKDGDFFINDRNIGLDNQKIMTNYLKPSTFMSQTKTLKNLIRRIERTRVTGKFYRYAFLNEGDHVFIIPEFFTGSTDFKGSPFGDVFGGIVPASIMNSVLLNEWIREFDSPVGLILYLVLVAIIVTNLIPLWGWSYLIISNTFICVLGLSVFSYFSVAIPWFFTALFSFVLGASLLILKARTEKKRQEIIEEMKLETEMISKENLLFEENQKVLLQEKREAAMIAAAFSPDKIPKWDHLKITGHHKCFDAASGDWFFFERSKDGQLCHTIMCDITGHGVQAALIVSTCKTVLNTVKENNPDSINQWDFPLKYLKMLNNILYIQGKTHHVTTFAGITVEPHSNKLHYVTCAHPPPVFHKKGEPLEKPKLLRMRNDPVGYEPEILTKMETINFEPGDKLVVHTDGIPITENFRFYKNYLKKNKDSWSDDPLDMYQYIWECIGKKTGKDPDDDVSIMIIERVDSQIASQLDDSSEDDSLEVGNLEPVKVS